MPQPHILVIEDNPMNMELVHDLLEFNGFRVSEAADAEEGIRRIESDRPDLILMDLQLPETDGYALLQSIRKKPEWNNLPVLALTAFAMRGDREKALAAGFAEVITKPINTRTFFQEVKKHLARA